MKLRSLLLLLALPVASLCVFALTRPAHPTRHTPVPHLTQDGERMENLDAQAEYQWRKLRDPKTGQIPENIRVRELAFASTLPKHFVTPRFAAAGSAATDPTTNWVARGPGNLGGRTRVIAIDIDNEQNLIAGGAMGGIWRSTDGGSHWHRQTTPYQAHDVTCALQDPRPGKHNIWYCGTGELLSTTARRTSHVENTPRWRTTDLGSGIYRSLDRGVTWQVLPSTVIGQLTKLDSVFDGVWNIVINPITGNLYAACYGAIMRSTDDGTSWQPVLGDLTHKAIVTDVGLASDRTLYAAMGTRAGDGKVSTTAGVWHSIDGVNWSQMTPPTWHKDVSGVALGLSPSNPNVLYLLAENIGAGVSDHSLWRAKMTGGAPAWSERTANIPFNGPGQDSSFNSLGCYALVIKVKPDDENTIYFGGTNLNVSTDGLATSTSQADNLRLVGGYVPAYGAPGELHPDMHAISFSPSNPSVVYVGNDGGVFRATDDGNLALQWEDLNGSYESSLGVIVAVDHSVVGDSSIITGFQDNGSLWSGSYDSNWVVVGGGDGSYCALTDHGNAYYESSQFGYLYRNAYDSATDQWKYTNANPSSGDNSQFLFVNPFLLDPNNQNRMYLAARTTIWRSDDLTSVPGGWVTMDNIHLKDTGSVSCLAMSTATKNRLYYGTEDGDVYLLDQATQKLSFPTKITSPLFPKHAYVACVEADEKNGNNVMAVFSNYGVRSLFFSSDAGTSWKDVSGNLEQNQDGTGDGPSCKWAKIVTYGGGTRYYVGTSVGLYYTDDLRPPNPVWTQDAPDVIGNYMVESIDARDTDGYIVIATQGAGVFSAFLPPIPALPSSVSSGTGAGTIDELRVYPNPASGSISYEYSIDRSGPVFYALLDVAGMQVRSWSYASRSIGLQQEHLDVSSYASGAYTLQVQSADGIIRKRFTIRR